MNGRAEDKQTIPHIHLRLFNKLYTISFMFSRQFLTLGYYFSHPYCPSIGLWMRYRYWALSSKFRQTVVCRSLFCLYYTNNDQCNNHIHRNSRSGNSIKPFFIPHQTQTTAPVLSRAKVWKHFSNCIVYVKNFCKKTSRIY